MKQETYRITLDSYEQNIVFKALNDLRNHQIVEHRPTEAVDKIMQKLTDAYRKQMSRYAER